jgi:hypothetical protein
MITISHMSSLPSSSSVPLSTVITREYLAKLSIIQPEDKENTASRMAQGFKRDILSYNSKGKTEAVISIYDERPEIQNNVLEKMKEIFVDSNIQIETTVSGYKNLAVNWSMTAAEQHQMAVLENQKAVLENQKAVEEHRIAVLANQKAIEENRIAVLESKAKAVLADADADDDSDSDSDDDPLNDVKLHIILSEPGNTQYIHETVFMIMVLTMVMSVAGSWIMVISYNM